MKLVLLILIIIDILAPVQSYATFFAYMGVASALVFANVGAAYGTSKSSIGIANLGVIEP